MLFKYYVDLYRVAGKFGDKLFDYLKSIKV